MSPRSFLAFVSSRPRSARHLFNPPIVRSPPQRRGVRRPGRRCARRSAPTGRRGPTDPWFATTSGRASWSSPRSRPRCGSRSCGSGRSTPIAAIVASHPLGSLIFAPATTTPRGPPGSATLRRRWVPSWPRSVGFGPTRSPQHGPGPRRRRRPASSTRLLRVRCPPRSARPRSSRRRPPRPPAGTNRGRGSWDRSGRAVGPTGRRSASGR